MRSHAEAAPLRNYRNANGLDFRRLAELANNSHGVTFDTVCARALKGITDEAELTRASILPATADWITIDDACKILHVSTHTWAQASNLHPTAIYWGVRAKTRSTKVKLEKGGKGSRGCGVLLYRPDIEKIQKIKREARISFLASLKVFHATAEGRL